MNPEIKRDIEGIIVNNVEEVRLAISQIKSALENNQLSDDNRIRNATIYDYVRSAKEIVRINYNIIQTGQPHTVQLAGGANHTFSVAEAESQYKTGLYEYVGAVLLHHYETGQTTGFEREIVDKWFNLYTETETFEYIIPVVIDDQPEEELTELELTELELTELDEGSLEEMLTDLITKEVLKEEPKPSRRKSLEELTLEEPFIF